MLKEIFKIGNKKLISVILVFILVFLSVTTSFANESQVKKINRSQLDLLINSFTADDYKNNPYLADVVKDIKEISKIKNELTLEELLNELNTTDSFKRHIDNQKLNDNKEKEAQLSTKEKEQIGRVDDLAQKYYDYYVKYGKFPTINEKGEISASFVASVTTTGAVGILGEMGYATTEARLALTLARAGVAIALGSALPAVVFLALVAGVVIVGYTVDYLINNQSALADVLRVDMPDTVVKANQSISATSALYWQIRQNNQKHFSASRNNVKPGGVVVHSPIDLTTAQGRMVIGLDTFNASYSDAAQAGAPPGYTSRFEAAHTANGYVANLNHFHAYIGATRWLDGHAFYY
jgi:hypothetical protein